MPSHPSLSPRRWTRPRQKGRDYWPSKGQAARQGFSPSLLFAAAINSRPPPTRGYALNWLPTSVHGSRHRWALAREGPTDAEARTYARSSSALPGISTQQTAAPQRSPSRCPHEGPSTGRSRARFTSAGSRQPRCGKTTPPRIGRCLSLPFHVKRQAPGGAGTGPTPSPSTSEATTHAKPPG